MTAAIRHLATTMIALANAVEHEDKDDSFVAGLEHDASAALKRVLSEL